MERGSTAANLQIDPASVQRGRADVPATVQGTDISASKLDNGKVPVYQGFIRYFPRAIEEVAKVSQAGAKKYNIGIFPTRWKEVPNGQLRYADAQMRHLLEEAKGTLVDKETQCYHLAQQIWNAMARLELFLAETGSGDPQPTT